MLSQKQKYIIKWWENHALGVGYNGNLINDFCLSLSEEQIAEGNLKVHVYLNMVMGNSLEKALENPYLRGKNNPYFSGKDFIRMWRDCENYVAANIAKEEELNATN